MPARRGGDPGPREGPRGENRALAGGPRDCLRGARGEDPDADCSRGSRLRGVGPGGAGGPAEATEGAGACPAPGMRSPGTTGGQSANGRWGRRPLLPRVPIEPADQGGACGYSLFSGRAGVGSTVRYRRHVELPGGWRSTNRSSRGRTSRPATSPLDWRRVPAAVERRWKGGAQTAPSGGRLEALMEDGGLPRLPLQKRTRAAAPPFC